MLSASGASPERPVDTRLAVNATTITPITTAICETWPTATNINPTITASPLMRAPSLNVGTQISRECVLGAIDPQIRTRQRHIQQPTVVGRTDARMGVALEEPAGHAHPRDGYDPGRLQRPDQAHQEAHHGLFLFGRTEVQVFLDGVRPARALGRHQLTLRSQPQRPGQASLDHL
jgi:hypothetical protein